VKIWSYEKSETAKLISWMQSIQICNKKDNPTKIALYEIYQMGTLTIFNQDGLGDLFPIGIRMPIRMV
jgi:hypothetical protein